MIFAGLMLCLGGFMSYPLITAMVSQAAGKKEQGVIVGAFKSLTAIADGVSPLIFGALFAATNRNEGCNGGSSSSGSGTANSSSVIVVEEQDAWTQGLPWLVAALFISAACLVLRRLPLEVGQEGTEVDFLPDSATVLEPSLVRRQSRAMSMMPRATPGSVGGAEGAAIGQCRPVSQSVMLVSTSRLPGVSDV